MEVRKVSEENKGHVKVNIAIDLDINEPLMDMMKEFTTKMPEMMSKMSEMWAKSRKPEHD